MLKRQIRARPSDFDVIGLFHQCLQRFHAGLQLPVIERAHLEIEILKGLGAHAGQAAPSTESAISALPTSSS